MIAVWIFFLFAQIPDSVSREPDPEKRYMLAIDAASKSLDAARLSDTKAKLEEAAVATEFALKSLEDMAKPPYKNTKNYKKAELRTREFLRRVDALLKDTGFDDRPSLLAAQARINAVHETVLLGVMSKKE